MNTRPSTSAPFFALACLLAAGSPLAARQAPATTPAPAPSSASAPAEAVPPPLNEQVEAEVRGNILSQRVGSWTLSALQLPDEYVRRFSDRIIRSSFGDRFRQVVATGPDDQDPEPAKGPVATPMDTPGLTILVRGASSSLRALEQSYREARPELRGFRAPILQNAPTAQQNNGVDAGLSSTPLRRFSQPAPGEVKQRRASEIVAQGLARDGILRTTLAVIQELGPSTLLRPDKDASLVLGDVGIPWDLLGCFGPEPDANTAAKRITVELARLATQNADEATVKAAFERMKFQWRPSLPGFTIAPEDGSLDLVTLRYQLTRGSDWRGKGDGGNLDMFRELFNNLPDLNFLLSTDADNIPEFLGAVKDWKSLDRVTVIAEPTKVTQWAADNAKAGFAPGPDAALAPATLAPRYASRGEDGSTFVPGDSFLLAGLKQAGWNAVQSPLLFQGGNLLSIRNPANGERLLLLGESELLRNLSLGLTHDETLAAFKSEFGVDRVEVIPSVSFHLDYEVSLRAHDGKMLAFVNDSGTAARSILYIGVAVLEDAQVLPPEAAQSARESLMAGRLDQVMESIGGPVLSTQVDFGQFPRPFARMFSIGPEDSDVGNFRLFMLALDWAAAMAMKKEDLPPDAFAQAYLLSFRRTEAARVALHKKLAELGFTLVPVPGLSEESRSITYINGVHDRTRYLMPAYGGLYLSLDAAAAGVFEKTLGESVKVIPIRSAESQRRAGAVHCSVGAYYAPPAVSSTP